ncbi:hypothetical protein DENSPDRAFT_586459 [Dentipellis sp. KUC8613]|nr:hypothetical protein DENSPDRAFT_586459 [Dentipellis sp. KUC8613]
MPLSLQRATLGAIFAECIMYGVSLTMSALTAIVFIKAESKGGLAHKPLLFSLLAMMILATVHVILSFIRVLNGFTSHHESAGSPYYAYLMNISNPMSVAKDAILVVQMVLGDSIYIWRCYVIWGRSRGIIVVPVATMISAFVGSCMVEYIRTHSTDVDVFDAPRHWIAASYALIIATIVYCNVAITWRIWAHTRRRFPVVFVIIEAGMLYTSNLLVFLGSYLARSYVEYVALDMLAPHVPIVFCLIILQIRCHRSEPYRGCDPDEWPRSMLDTPVSMEFSTDRTPERRSGSEDA